MTILAMSFALCLTVVLSVGLGIGVGYLVIVGILNAFSRNRASRKPQAAALASSAGSTRG